MKFRVIHGLTLEDITRLQNAFVKLKESIKRISDAANQTSISVAKFSKRYLKMMEDNKRIYPCVECGILRSKNEGGTTFTVCDNCWDNEHARSKSSNIKK